MDHVWATNPSNTAPNPPGTPLLGYPVDGITGTVPGAWWYHQITEEIRNTVLAAGLVPAYNATNQLAQAVALIAGATVGGGGGGAIGQGAYTVTTNTFVVPAVNSSVTVLMGSTLWLTPGQMLYLGTAGYYRVNGVPSQLSASLTNVGATGNATPATVVAVGVGVVAAGLTGAVGNAGSSAYSTVTSSFVQPNAGANVSVQVGSTAWMVVNQPIFVATGGAYTVGSITSATAVVLTNSNGASNAAPGVTVPANAGITSGGATGATGIGVPGQAAFSTTVGSFTMPASQAGVSVTLSTTAWMIQGLSVYVGTAGYMTVSTISSATAAILVNSGAAGNAASGTTIANGSPVSSAGVQGANGATGISAYSTVSTAFAQPATNSPVAVTFSTTAWMVVGQNVYVGNGGYYSISSVNSGFNATLLNLPVAGNATAGTNIPIGSGCSPSGLQGASGNGTGTVTSVSISGSNGFTGSVATANSTPNLTLSITANGMLKGNGTAISAATAGTDYASPGTSTNFSAAQTFSAGMTLGGANSSLTLNASQGTVGQVLVSAGNGQTPGWATLTYGSVSSVTVAPANGFTGTVATNTTTPVVTIATSINGLLLGNGTAISAATAGTDYVSPATATTYAALQSYSLGINHLGATSPLLLQGSAGTAGQVLVSAGTGATPTWGAGASGTVTTLSVTSANGFTGTVATASSTPAITLTTSVTGLLKGNGTAISAATAGTDYLTPSAAANYTATQTYSGSTTAIAFAVVNAKELTNVVGAAPATTQTVYLASGALNYFTTAASANWTFNFAHSAGTSLNTAMSINDSITLAIYTTQGGTAYYPTNFQIDGSAVTPKWLGGSGAPTSGNASGIDVYTFTITKTASATYTVIAAQSQYK